MLGGSAPAAIATALKAEFRITACLLNMRPDSGLGKGKKQPNTRKIRQKDRYPAPRGERILTIYPIFTCVPYRYRTRRLAALVSELPDAGFGMAGWRLG